jgi:hypothetical protein
MQRNLLGRRSGTGGHLGASASIAALGTARFHRAKNMLDPFDHTFDNRGIERDLLNISGTTHDRHGR